MNLYTCTICHESNSARRLTCKSCGTTPARYSILGTESRYQDDELGPHEIPVVAAHGCLRLENTRTARVYLRTVPLDYYAG